VFIELENMVINLQDISRVTKIYHCESGRSSDYNFAIYFKGNPQELCFCKYYKSITRPVVSKEEAEQYITNLRKTLVDELLPIFMD
jgi:hypothetical protein